MGNEIIASPKVDGIRVLCHPELGPVTRSLKKVPNNYIRSILLDDRLKGFDGEVVVGDLAHPNQFNETTSGVMSAHGFPDFTFHVFDQCWNHASGWDQLSRPYNQRVLDATYRVEEYEKESVANAGISRVRMLEYEDLSSNTSHGLTAILDMMEQDYLERGFEGMMIRRRNGHYKLNRSTLKEGILVKVKRFEDCEAKVVGYVELERNQNEATKNALGYTERSSHNHGKVAAGVLGALVVSASPWGEFQIGSGFDAATRARLWEDRASLVGKHVKFKHQKVGQVDKPRFPIFLGFRGDE